MIVERLPEKVRDKDDEDKKLKRRKSKRQAKKIQNLPQTIVKEPPPPSLIQRIKSKISAIMRPRNKEIEKMKANQESLKQRNEDKDDTPEDTKEQK